MKKWNNKIDSYIDAQREHQGTHGTTSTNTEVNETINLSEALANATRTLTALSHAIEASRSTLANYSALSSPPVRVSVTPEVTRPIVYPEFGRPEASNLTALVAQAKALAEQERTSLIQQNSRTSITEPAGDSVPSATGQALPGSNVHQRETRSGDLEPPQQPEPHEIPSVPT